MIIAGISLKILGAQLNNCFCWIQLLWVPTSTFAGLRPSWACAVIAQQCADASALLKKEPARKGARSAAAWARFFLCFLPLPPTSAAGVGFARSLDCTMGENGVFDAHLRKIWMSQIFKTWLFSSSKHSKPLVFLQKLTSGHFRFSWEAFKVKSVINVYVVDNLC